MHKVSVRVRTHAGIRQWLFTLTVSVVAVGVSLQGLSVISDLWEAVPASVQAGGIIFFLALGCEYFDSSLGMGYGTTLTPLLLIGGYEPLQIVPAVLFSEAVSGLLAGIGHHRGGNIDFLRDSRARSTAWLLGGLSTVGAVAAVVVAIHIPRFWFTLLIAVIICSMGLVLLVTAQRRFAFRIKGVVLFGTVAAFNKGLSGGGYGPLVTSGQMVSGVPPKHAVAVTSVAESLTCVVGLSAYWLFEGPPDWALTAPLMAGAALSVPLAVGTVRRLSEARLRCAVGLLTLLLGGLAVVKLSF